MSASSAAAAATTPVMVAAARKTTTSSRRTSLVVRRGGVTAATVSGGRQTVVVAKGVRGDDNVIGASSESTNSSTTTTTNTSSTTRRAMLVDAAALLASTAVLPAFADEEVAVVAEAVEAVEAAAPAPPAPPPPAPKPPPAAKKAVPLASVAQPVMAYEFSYPTESADGAAIRWTPSRTRDTYSSAEPMSPDARQRIVYELISFKGPMTCTVTVGPAPPKLAAKDPKEWKPKDVAEAVLADRATGRIATGQKISLAEVESVKKVVIGEDEYVYYEYISQGSPNLAERESTTFRHSLGEYLYTYTISAPETLWDVNAEGFAQGIKTFRLTKPDKKKFREPGNEGILPPLPF